MNTGAFMVQRSRFRTAGLFLFHVFVSLLPSASAFSSTQVIIDTDMAVDDVMAIAALLGSREIEIKAITTVEGSSSLQKGTQNLLSILEELGYSRIPVGKGGACSSDAPVETPPWRAFSESLGGICLFPPAPASDPQSTDALLGQILPEANDGEITLLCLGPLTNIASFFDAHPVLKKKINKLVIMTDLDTCSGGFNLFRDKKAAGKVFSAGMEIVCIGGQVTDQIPLTQIYFDDITSKPTRLASLLKAVFHNSGERLMQGHFKLWDPVTACYLIHPEFFDIEKKSRLLYESDIHCYYALDVEKEKIYAALADLWSRVAPIQASDPLHGFEDVAISLVDYVKAFHGHLGPYVMLGCRAGKLAVLKLNCHGHFDLKAEVHAPLEPPASCFIDGVQLGSGCSMGKRNITAIESESIRCVFISEKGEKITISLKDEIPAWIKKEIAARGVEPTGLFFYHLPDDAVFKVEQADLKTSSASKAEAASSR